MFVARRHRDRKQYPHVATRYSGALTISITLDPSDTYSVTLTGEGYSQRLRGIGIAPALAARCALDSAEAYDAVAQAAVSFAAHEDGTDAVYSHALCDDSGEAIIRRRKPRTQRQQDQDNNKSTSNGQYQKGPVCEFCSKAAGFNYMSDPESLSIDYLGLTLCERQRCIAKRDAMSLDERRAVYRINGASR